MGCVPGPDRSTQHRSAHFPASRRADLAFQPQRRGAAMRCRAQRIARHCSTVATIFMSPQMSWPSARGARAADAEPHAARRKTRAMGGNPVRAS